MDTIFNLSDDLGYYALAAILMSAMIAFGNRTYRKDYLSRWSVAFLLIGTANIVGYALGRPRWGGAVPPLAATVSGIIAGAVLWSVMRGGFEMAMRRPLKSVVSRALLVVATAAGAVTGAIIGLVHDLAWSGLMALDAAVVGSAVLLTAMLLIWERRRRLAPGFVVCAVSLALMGISVILDGARLLTGALDTWVFPMVLFSLVLSGCSVLLFAVEDDRQAALLAATQIEHIAYYDPLTGLPNRSLFLDRLIAVTSMNQGDEKAAVLFIDIDHFKQINDTFGHSVGDVVISTVANRIKKTLRSSDTAARYAGDEFIVLIEDLKSITDATRIAEKILSALEGPILTGGHEIRVTGTIGISIYPTHGVYSEELIKSADAAMYLAKQEGRNRYGMFVAGTDGPVRTQAELEEALGRAIEEEQLSILYQPIVSLSDGSIRGVEAFVRWHHDVLGTVPPSEFIPVAESSSLIGPLGELVLHRVCRDASNWNGVVENQFIFISINLSPEQFADPELIPRIRRALSRWKLDPGLLRFEIAESTAMADLRRSGRILEALKAAGVKVAIDHFGVGQSSLSHLALFPVEMLKLDRSLISGKLGTLRYGIFGAAAGIARRLGKIVSVEGIETSTQRDLAVREGCDLGQGYFFGAPTTADAILNLLAPASVGHPEEQEKSDLDEEITLVSRKAPGEIPKNADNRMVTLVVDDDERMRNLMAILLRRIGHEVVTAENGLELLSRLEEVNQSQVQLIVLDLMMPKMSGWQVLEHLSESLPDLLPRVLLITAAGSHEISKIDSRLYGVVLEKPFDHGDFYAAAAQCVNDGKTAGGGADETDGSYLVH